MGAVMCESSKRANEVRMASLVAGFPDTVPIYTVNRWVWVLWGSVRWGVGVGGGWVPGRTA